MSKLQKQVFEFHREFGHPVGEAPGNPLPSDDRVRLRASLIVEECFEMLESLFSAPAEGWESEKNSFAEFIIYAPVKVDLVALADALGDIDYVVEGCRLEFGIDGGPIADEIHRSNMAKRGGPKRPDGKHMKPEGWKPPDIAGVLAAQEKLTVK